tara:strand:+ start:555 stop:998 length:444 start_codon:yes stop_codon:yes gene_type:complete
MKKLLFFVIIILCSFNIKSQSPKALKKLKKANIMITNRGIDFNKVFVPVCVGFDRLQIGNKGFENFCSQTMFEAGLEVGTYYLKKTANQNTNMFKGDYVFWVNLQDDRIVISIKDLNNNNRMVGSVSFNILHKDYWIYVIKEFMNSN